MVKNVAKIEAHFTLTTQHERFVSQADIDTWNRRCVAKLIKESSVTIKEYKIHPFA